MAITLSFSLDDPLRQWLKKPIGTKYYVSIGGHMWFKRGKIVASIIIAV
jgi:hypothetical protein